MSKRNQKLNNTYSAKLVILDDAKEIDLSQKEREFFFPIRLNLDSILNDGYTYADPNYSFMSSHFEYDKAGKYLFFIIETGRYDYEGDIWLGVYMLLSYSIDEHRVVSTRDITELTDAFQDKLDYDRVKWRLGLFDLSLQNVTYSDRILLTIDYSGEYREMYEKEGFVITDNYMYDMNLNLLDSGIAIKTNNYINNLYKKDNSPNSVDTIIRTDGTIDSTFYLKQDEDYTLFDKKNRSLYVLSDFELEEDTLALGFYNHNYYKEKCKITGLGGRFRVFSIWENFIYIAGHGEYAGNLFRINMESWSVTSAYFPHKNIIGVFNAGLVFDTSGNNERRKKYAFVEWPEN